MNCLFCEKPLPVLHERYDSEWDCISSRTYNCPDCHTKFNQTVIYDKIFNNETKSDWHWVDSGKEALTYYKMLLQDYEIEYYVAIKGPFIIRRWDSDHKFIWEVCRFKTAPPNIHPSNLLERIKIWILFS